MDIDTPSPIENPPLADDVVGNTTKTTDGMETPMEGDIDMNAEQPSLGTKHLSNGSTGAGIISGKVGGGAAGGEGRAAGTGETEEAFPTKVADFFKPRRDAAPKSTSAGEQTNGGAGGSHAKGKGKEVAGEAYLAGREGLPW